MKESKSAKLNQQQQQDNHQSVHLSSSKLANLFDPDAYWDKVTTHCLLFSVVFQQYSKLL
ncbi:unnamed protein product [Thlaspi arvense]|uniref:Uncharacterized protein n=1 Tax=Thlaspi arvense TaxID=13288 RepID=A0AAU9SQS6_THLAR|nr:unnamed protein product [Thlaspi arvense]